MMHSTCNSCTFKMFSSTFLVALVFSSVAFGMDFEEGNLEEVPKMEPFDEEINADDDTKLQNENARFNFGYKIQDEINGGYVERSEEREGLSLKGEYTYSDGFFQRTVAYEADENGYRVTKMDVEPIGNGPIMNKMGRAIVSMLVSGVNTEYAIQAEPVDGNDEVLEEGILEEKSTNE